MNTGKKRKKLQNFSCSNDCGNCSKQGRIVESKGHYEDFCAHPGGEYEGDFKGALKAMKAHKKAIKRQKLQANVPCSSSASSFASVSTTGELEKMSSKTRQNESDINKHMQQLDNLEKRTGLLAQDLDKEKKARTSLRWQLRAHQDEVDGQWYQIDEMQQTLNEWKEWYDYRRDDYGKWFHENYSWPNDHYYDRTNSTGFRTQRSQDSYVMTQRATTRMKMQEELER